MNTITKGLLALLCIFAAGPSGAATAVINTSEFQFSPGTVTLNQGDTVQWVNHGFATHTTTSTQPAGLWDKTLAPGASFSRVFTSAGSYNYHCSIHPAMTGTITVRSAEQTRIQTGKAILSKVLPISLNLQGKNADLAYLGSYIVNAQSACANCHSCPTYAAGHNPYNGKVKRLNTAGYLAGGVSVAAGGLVAVSANLTPDNTGKPAGLTRDAFKEVLRTGHDPDVPGALLPVMPWPFFGMMTDNDLNAVYEYLSAVPPATTPVDICAEPGL